MAAKVKTRLTELVAVGQAGAGELAGGGVSETGDLTTAALAQETAAHVVGIAGHQKDFNDGMCILSVQRLPHRKRHLLRRPCIRPTKESGVVKHFFLESEQSRLSAHSIGSVLPQLLALTQN